MFRRTMTWVAFTFAVMQRAQARCMTAVDAAITHRIRVVARAEQEIGVLQAMRRTVDTDVQS